MLRIVTVNGIQRTDNDISIDNETDIYFAIPVSTVWGAGNNTAKLMGKKSHAPLFTLFVYFTHLVPPTGPFWTNIFALPFKSI